MHPSLCLGRRNILPSTPLTTNTRHKSGQVPSSRSIFPPFSFPDLVSVVAFRVLLKIDGRQTDQARARSIRRDSGGEESLDLSIDLRRHGGESRGQFAGQRGPEVGRVGLLLFEVVLDGLAEVDDELFLICQ